MLRRNFLKSTAAFASAAAARAQDRPSASDRITMGVIGTGNQGTGDMQNFLADERVQVVAVCDLNKESPGYWDGDIAGREPARILVEWHYARAKRSGSYKGAPPTKTSATSWPVRTSTPFSSPFPIIGTPSPSSRPPAPARTSMAKSPFR